MHNHAADLCKSGDYHLGTRHKIITLDESKVLTLDIAAAASEAESVQSAPASPGVQVILTLGAGDQAEGQQVIILLSPRLRRQAGGQAESAEVRK